MKKYSAGILLHRQTKAGRVEVLLVHPGGPFWAKKDDGAWSLPKGEYEPDEEAYEAARREFREEIGIDLPEGLPTALGEITQPSRKVISAWAVNANLDLRDFKSNEFEMEWPRGSGKTASFPEVDRAEWMPISVARGKILKGQEPFLDKLLVHLVASGVVIPDEVDEPDQGSLF